MALPPRGLEHLLVDALRRAGAREVERFVAPPEARPRVRARWLVDPADRVSPPGDPTNDAGPMEFRRWVEVALEGALPGVKLEARWGTFDPGPWLAARGERELRIPGLPPMVLLPGVAFGDGDHPTTLRCLRLLARLVVPGSRVVDLGSGSGLLTVAAALLGADPVVAVEVDPAGCLETRANALRNGLDQEVTVVRHRVTAEDPGPLAPGPGPWPWPWNGVMANLEGGSLLPLLPRILQGLEPEGWLLASGLHQGEAEALKGVLASGELGASVEETFVDDGWVTALVRAGGPKAGRP